MDQKTTEKEYVWNDGVRISDEQLLSMAKNAGSYAQAEHYLCSLLAHGLIYQLPNYINKVNEVRAHYGVVPIPVPKSESVSEALGSNSRHLSLDDLARKKYGMMSDAERCSILKVSLQILMEDHEGLFEGRRYWIGIYLVIRDRLDSALNKNSFDEFAKRFTPMDWPELLTIGSSTMSNFSHYVDYEDRFEAYYDMDNNPWEELCNVFWEIVKQQILG